MLGNENQRTEREDKIHYKENQIKNIAKYKNDIARISKEKQMKSKQRRRPIKKKKCLKNFI